jgi:hypothetical protein
MIGDITGTPREGEQHDRATKCILHDQDNCHWCYPVSAPAPKIEAHYGYAQGIDGGHSRIYHRLDCWYLNDWFDRSESESRSVKRITASAQTIRQMLADGQLDRGCRHCGANVDAGRPQVTRGSEVNPGRYLRSTGDPRPVSTRRHGAG